MTELKTPLQQHLAGNSEKCLLQQCKTQSGQRFFNYLATLPVSKAALCPQSLSYTQVNIVFICLPAWKAQSNKNW